ncbi:hypothetical protein [Streptomyces sp. NBRC 110035]|uniref:hypothetical protein n=1 Tax=Streptomyces sp. NBRC 110035 TaxID=1547867 RepID=UPI0007C74FAA|nr:hypothetical protein [Streptomyces sp. NBRC 110035]
MNLFTSLMRTVVPIVAGLLLGLAAKVGLDLDDGLVTTYVTAALTAGYYALWRVLEEAADRLGWEPLRTLAGLLLGWARPPQYEQPATVPLRVKLQFGDPAEFAAEINRMVERRGGSLR